MKRYNSKIRNQLNKELRRSSNRIRLLSNMGNQHRIQFPATGVRQRKLFSISNIKDLKLQSGFGISLRKELLFLLAACFIVIFITGYELKLIKTHLLIENIIQEGINYDAFREMKLDEKDLKKAEKKINHLLKNEPQLEDMDYIDGIGFLTFSMMAEDYNLLDNNLVDENTFIHGIGEVSATSGFQELYSCYKAVLADLEYFPVPKVETADISYYDTWYELRNYGGRRRHEGTDLMASNNQRGFFPIISITDGTVEKMGWLEQGGYRIGIRSDSGGYFYYAHLYSYAPDLDQGDKVIAGQLLGFMGDSGYGSEGTIGQFDVHLHLGIYVDSSIGEMSVNPFWILQFLEKYRTNYSIE